MQVNVMIHLGGGKQNVSNTKIMDFKTDVRQKKRHTFW